MQVGNSFDMLNSIWQDSKMFAAKHIQKTSLRLSSIKLGTI